MANRATGIGNIELGGFDSSELNRVEELLNNSAEQEKRRALASYEFEVGLIQKKIDYETTLEERLAKAGKTRDYAAHKEKIKALEAESKTANKARQKQIAAEIKDEQKKLDKIEKYKDKLRIKDAAKARKQTADEFSRGNLATKLSVLSDAWKEGAGGTKGASLANALSTLASGLGDMIAQLDSQIDSIAGKKSAIDTRLQGSKNSRNYAGSY